MAKGLSLIALICVAMLWAPAAPAEPGFDRAQWGHWIDEDGDCQNTRQEVLARDAIWHRLNDPGCRVVLGIWFDPYTAKRINAPRLIDIDHLVALREAHVSGAANWSRGRKRAFANWMGNLRATHRRINRQKGARDPAGWLPAAAQCDYVRDWVYIKARWALDLDGAERAAIAKVLAGCDP